MLYTKPLADVLTSVRFILGVYLVWLGTVAGADVLPQAAVVLLLAWITDVLDGPLARHDPRKLTTWVGQHDLTADLTVAAGVWIYLWAAGFISPSLWAGYLLLTLLSLWLTRSVHVGWGVQTIPYAAMIFIALTHARPFGVVMLTWPLILVIATWPRFPREKVPEFIHGIATLFRK